ncbi:uncharacterized protein LOC119364744 isoform X4 [Triticum dicoccoides]|uniref:uncharacterized protein LOC119364744 isoform X4 n=1 Tax=Triticum dicoccoides TaxID=85692 RepID=UPI00188E12EA|nr:uncharacterized protein LOC119364744 isoform X4 [Triticum dicoccoides]
MQWWARCALKPPTAGHAEHGEKQDIGRCSCSLRHLIGRTKVSANIGMAEPHIDVSASIWNLGWQCHTLISRLSLPLPCFLKPLVVSFSSSVAHSERSYWAMDKIYSR